MRHKPQFAIDTSVSVEKSEAEIKSILARHGANQFGVVQDIYAGLASVQFISAGRQIRFMLELPKRDSEDFWKTPSRGTKRDPAAAYRLWEQACRQRWRALCLCIKAKLEAVAAGISEFEDEFLAHVVLPNGKTVGETIRPEIEQAYLGNKGLVSIAGYLPAPKV